MFSNKYSKGERLRMNLEKYVEQVLIEKGLELTKENREIVNESLVKRFNAKYNAVCIGIDETLLETNEISDETLETIYKLLMKHISIVLVTGRGESGLKDFNNDLCKNLIQKYNITRESLKNIIGVSHNGEFLFYTSGNDDFFDSCNLLVDSKELDNLKDIESDLDNFFVKKLADIELLTSICSTYDKIAAFRILMKDTGQAEKIEEYLKEFIILENKRLKSNIRYSIGRYNNEYMFQVDVGDKEKALRKVEQFLGIPENSMLRIGDQGDIKGNDYSMLNCEQGFSVDKCSSDVRNCYPICDEDGNLIKGIDATNYIIKNSKIFPTVCLRKPDKQRYKMQLANSERNIILGRKSIIANYNSMFNRNMKTIDGFEDVFDKKSGAIVFDDSDWYLIDESNELKALFNEDIEGNYMYSLDTDTSRILRGSDTYYYFLANKDEKEAPSRLNIIEWYRNYMDFFKKAMHILQNFKIKNKPEDIKLLLGIMDNLRNVALINLNAAIVTEFPQFDRLYLSLEPYMENEQVKTWYEICTNIYKEMEELCFDSENQENHPLKILKILEQVIANYPLIINAVLEKKDSGLNKRAFRAYREIDNYIENYITMNLAIEKMSQEDKNFMDKKVNFSGLAYGGLELPLLAQNILSNKCDIDASAILIKKKSYDELHSKDYFEKLKQEKLEIKSKRELREGFNIVSDDNVLTGVTLQSALELLFSNDIYINSLAVVRYPSLNRVEQMFGNDRGAIDTSKFTTYIKGLIFPSPYSKIKNGSNYLDELKIFNKSRDRIVRYLYKNGRYTKESEVYRTINPTEDVEH